MATATISRVMWASNVRNLPFAGKLEAAVAGGFTKLSMPIRVYREQISAGITGLDLKRLAATAGISLDFMDGMSSWAPLRYPTGTDQRVKLSLAAMDIPAHECLDICETLGLHHVVAIGAFDQGALTTDDVVGAFAAFCRQADERGIWVDLEFIPMLGIPDLQAAWEIVRLADCRNSGILFDTWHFMRGRPDLELLRAIPAERIVTVQIVDALSKPRGGSLWEDAGRYRMFPGEGELPLVPMLQILSSKGCVKNIGPEVFSDEIDALGALEIGRRAAKTTDTVAAEAGFALAKAS
jgi:sugar phosphate isomerase/epimerase